MRSAIDVINTLAAAKGAGRLKAELKKYTKPALLILDELGYLPIDKTGADLLFQVISLRYEQGAIVITSNRAFKEWPKIFNNDNTLTASHPGSAAASRRDGDHRRQKLPHERPT